MHGANARARLLLIRIGIDRQASRRNLCRPTAVTTKSLPLMSRSGTMRPARRHDLPCDRRRFRHDHCGNTAQAEQAAAQLSWLANCHILKLPEDRRHHRFTPRNRQARLILPNGYTVARRVIDFSQSGAAIAIPANPRSPASAAVTSGRTAGRMVRHIDEDFAVEFTRPQHPDFVEENVTDN